MKATELTLRESASIRLLRCGDDLAEAASLFVGLGEHADDYSKRQREVERSLYAYRRARAVFLPAVKVKP